MCNLHIATKCNENISKKCENFGLGEKKWFKIFSYHRLCVFFLQVFSCDLEQSCQECFPRLEFLFLEVWKAEVWIEWGRRHFSLLSSTNHLDCLEYTSFHSPRGKLLHIFQYSAQRLPPLGSPRGKTLRESLWVLIHFVYISFIVFLLFHNFGFHTRFSD